MNSFKSNITLLFSLIFFCQFIYSCKKEEKETPEEPKFFSPSGLKAIVFSDSTIKISWKDNSNIETSFQVQRKDGSGQYRLIKEVPANDTVFIDSDVAPNLLYTYRVRAENKSIETSFSDEASIKLSLPIPVLSSTAIDDSSIKLSWTDNSALESGFVLERSTNGQPFVTIATPAKNVQSYADNTIQVNVDYRYRIKAKNILTETDYSNIVTTKIQFNAPGLNCSLPGGNTVILTWSNNSQFEQGYIIEQAFNDGAFTAIATVATPLLTYKIENLDISKKYAFRVKAYSAKNTSAYSILKKVYYNHSRYIVTERYPAQQAVEGQVALSPSANLIAASGYYSRNVVIANRSIHSTSILSTGHIKGTFALRFSPDNQYLAITSAGDGNLEIWNVTAQTLYKTAATGMEATFALAFNSAGNLLAVGGTGTSKILVYNFPSMTLKYTLATDNSNVRDLLFYENDTRLISCGNNDKIQFWNLGTLQLEKTLAGTPGHIGTIDLNADAGLITSSSYDATSDQLKIWNTNGNLVRAINVGTGVSSTFFGPDNNIYCSDYFGNVQVIDQSGNILNKIPIGSPIYFADFNKTLKLLTTFSADGNINVLTNAPVWQEY
jgi:WD40 repeat protein